MPGTASLHIRTCTIKWTRLLGHIVNRAFELGDSPFHISGVQPDVRFSIRPCQMSSHRSDIWPVLWFLVRFLAGYPDIRVTGPYPAKQQIFNFNDRMSGQFDIRSIHRWSPKRNLLKYLHKYRAKWQDVVNIFFGVKLHTSSSPSHGIKILTFFKHDIDSHVVFSGFPCNEASRQCPDIGW